MKADICGVIRPCCATKREYELTSSLHDPMMTWRISRPVDLKIPGEVIAALGREQPSLKVSPSDGFQGFTDSRDISLAGPTPTDLQLNRREDRRIYPLPRAMKQGWEYEDIRRQESKTFVARIMVRATALTVV